MVDVVEEYLSTYPEEIQAIVGKLRGMARSVMPGAREFLYYDAITFSISDSPLERICYVLPMKSHVTLGFLFGAKLDDQNHLLKGTGKQVRHVKVGTLEEAKNPALKELVRAAWIHGVDSIPKTERRIRQRRTLKRPCPVARRGVRSATPSGRRKRK